MATFCIQMKYVTFINGKPYFQRRWPESLRQHPAIATKMFKRRIHVDAGDDEALARERKRLNQYYEDYVALLSTANEETLAALELERTAKALLGVHNLPEGLFATNDEYLNDLSSGIVWESGAFDALIEHDNRETAEQRLLPKSAQAQVQQYAWKLLSTPNPQARSSKLFSEAFDDYWKAKGWSTANKKQRRERAIWNDFLKINGDSLITSESVKVFQQNYVNARTGAVKVSSIQRELTSIFAPINRYNETLSERLAINKLLVKTPKRTQVDRKPPILHEQQQELMAMLPSLPEWKQLYFLIALHSGFHPSEAVVLTKEDFIFDDDLPRVALNNTESGGKTEHRTRVVPLVFDVTRIHQLIHETDALTVMMSKTTDNIGTQIKNVLIKIDPQLTAYSLRHTLKHNGDAAMIDSSVIAALGGWSGASFGLSGSFANYGQRSKDMVERLRPRVKALEAMLKHLLGQQSTKIDNVVPLSKLR